MDASRGGAPPLGFGGQACCSSFTQNQARLKEMRAPRGAGPRRTSARPAGGMGCSDVRAYAIRRLLLVIPTVFLISVVVFFMMRLVPGDVLDEMARGVAYGSAAEYQRFELKSPASSASTCRFSRSTGAGWGLCPAGMAP